MLEYKLVGIIATAQTRAEASAMITKLVGEDKVDRFSDDELNEIWDLDGEASSIYPYLYLGALTLFIMDVGDARTIAALPPNLRRNIK